MILAAFFTIATDNELLSKYKEQTPDTDCKQVLAQFGDNIYEMVYAEKEYLQQSNFPKENFSVFLN